MASKRQIIQFSLSLEMLFLLLILDNLLILYKFYAEQMHKRMLDIIRNVEPFYR